MSEQQDPQDQNQEQPAEITAADLSARIKSGDYDAPQEKPAASEQKEELSDEEFEKQWKDYESGKSEIPNSKKSLKRLFEANKKGMSELEKKFTAQLSEQEKKLKDADISSLAQKRINILNAYEKWFAGSPEKTEKDFASPAEYRSYVKQRDFEKEQFEAVLSNIDATLESKKAAKEAEAAKSQQGAKFQFKDEAEAKEFLGKVEAYKKLVPEFEKIGNRWTELPVATLSVIVASPYSPAILHAAVEGELAKYPEREQLKAVFELEAKIAADLGKQTPPAPPPPASALPNAPPKMKGSGRSPNPETVITAKEIAQQIREGKI